MENNDYIDKIHRYLLEEMSAKERSDFESEISRNEALRSQIAFEKKLLLGLRLAGDEVVKKTIAETDRQLGNEGFFDRRDKIININQFLMKRFLSIAASAILLAGAAWWFFLREKPSDPKAAFAQYFKPETTKVQEIIAGFPSAFAGGQDTLREALKLYESGDYNKAAAAFDSVLVKHPQNDTAQFYLGMAHLNASRYARAVELLTPLSVSETTVFKLDATWYLGLCYLQVENGISKAKELFSALSEDADYKDRQAAKGILRMIDK